MTDKVETLAEYAHEAWSGWMRHLFGRTLALGETESIEPDDVARWKRQMNTPYEELPENEKESDRKEAREILALLE